jgi:hypothetical protein
MYTGFVTADVCPWYLDDLVDVTLDHPTDFELLEYDAGTNNWTNTDIYKNPHNWYDAQSFYKTPLFRQGIELTNTTSNNLIAFDGFVDYIISHDYITGRLTFGVPPFSHENIFNSDIWINNSDIYVDTLHSTNIENIAEVNSNWFDANIGINNSGNLYFNSNSDIIWNANRQIASGTGLINLIANDGFTNEVRATVNGDVLLQFIKGLSPTGSIKINTATANYQFVVYSDDGTSVIQTQPVQNEVYLKNKVVINSTSDVSPNALTVQGSIQADDYRSSDNSLGWTGTFLNGDGNTVTVKNGLIVDVS